MSKTIDERVVSMQFDNRNFENNVKTTMSTLDRFKQKLNFSGATKGLENINAAANKVNMSGMGTAIDSIQAKFSSLQVIGATALANITNSAINASKRIASAFTIDPIKSGFQEYETQINAIQTILANTQSKGSTLDDVNNALDELNKYADQTIYNFTEMTRNIGTFTAAGVDLDKSVTSIKGIANLAAVSGSNAQQASTAMYQLSQAIASGRVALQDWNSVVNAGMGGELFQNALKRTAEHFGYNVDGMIKKYGSFRESLTKGEWLTTEVLTETLTQLSGAYSEADLIAQGYTAKQAKEITELAETAVNAATKVKTFTQLFDTLKEAAQSGWTQSWEIIIGDFEEAQELLTEVSDTFGGIINKSSDARNAMLQGWKDLGGRKALIDAVRNAFEGLGSILTPIGEAFREVFPPMTSERLYNLTVGLKELTAKFKISDETAKNLKSTFKGLFSAVGIVVDAITALVKGAGTLVGSLFGISGGFLGVTAVLGNFITKIRNGIKETNLFGGAVKIITDLVVGTISKIKELGGAINNAFKGSGYQGIVDAMTGLAEGFGNIDFSKGIGVLNEGIFAAILLGIRKFINGLSDPFEGANNVLENITGILDDVRGCFQAYQEQLKAGALMKIASAIALLAASIFVISTIDGESLAKSLGAITVLFIELIASLNKFGKLSTSLVGTIKAIPLMISLGVAMNLLAIALKNISTVDTDGLIKGLVGVGILMAELNIFLNNAKFTGKITSTSVGIVILSSALVILSKAVKNLGSMDWMSIGRGLATIAGLLIELTLFTKLNGSATSMISTSVGMLILGKAMTTLVSVVKSFGSMSWDGIGKGLAAMAGALVEVSIGMYMMPKNIITIGTGLTIVSYALDILSKSIAKFSGMSWDEIGKGLAVLGASLIELSIALHLMNGTLGGSAALIIATTAMSMMVPVMKSLGDLSWSQVIIGLTTLAGAFAVVGVAGLLLSPLLPVLLGLSGAFALLGVSIFGIGAGLAALATGFTALAAAGVAGATSVVSSLHIIITGIIGLIPAVIKSLAEGIVVFIQTIANSSAVIADSLGIFITEILKALAKYSPMIVDAILEFLIGIMESIAKNMPKLITAAVKLIGSFFQGVFDAFKGISPDAIFKGIAAVGLLAGLMAALSAITGMIPGAMLGVLGIAAVIAELGLLLAAIGGLSQIPGLSWLVKEGGYFLQAIGTAIGQFIGGIAGGILGGITSSFPKIGSDLSDFMLNLEPFIKGIKRIDPAMFEGVKVLTKTILLLTAADIVNGIASWITGGNSMAKFADQLIPFGEGLRDYSKAIAGIKPETITNSAIAAKSLVELANNLPNSGGIISWFNGNSSFEKFGEQIVPFGEALKDYSKSISGIKPKSISDSATAAKALVELANNLPNTGGIISWFNGSQNFTKFGEQIVSFGEALKEYSNSINGIKPSVISDSATAAKTLVELAKELPKTGGLSTIFKGDNDLGSFGNKLKQFGEGMKSYSESITGIKPKAISESATAAKTLSELANNLPNSGGLNTILNGDNDISSFGTQLINFGKGLKDYANSISGIDPKTIENSATAAKSLSELANGLPTTGGLSAIFNGTDDISTFGSQLVGFGRGLKSYSESISGIDPNVVSSSATASKALAELANTLPKTGGLTSLLNGEQNLSDFAFKLTILGKGIKDYATEIEGIKPETITNSATATKALTELAGSIPAYGGIMSWINGTQDMAIFGDKLKSLGEGIKKYSTSVEGIKPETITNSATAAKALVELANNLPATGGAVSWFTGEVNMETFGNQLTPFGKALKDYSISVAGIKPDVITSSISAAQALAELASNLPSPGGIVSWFMGEADMTVFGDQLKPFGTALKDYSAEVAGIKPEVVTESATAAKALSELANNLPTTGGLMAWFTGDNDMTTFGSQLKPFGTAIKDYAKEVAEVKPESITNSVSAITALANMTKSIPDSGGFFSWFTGGSGISDFGNNIKPLGEGLKSYSDSISGIKIEPINNSVSAIDSIVKSIKGMDGINTKNVSSFVTALNTLAQSNVDGFVKAFTNSSSKMISAGIKAMDSLIEGLKSKQSSLTSAATSMITSAVKGINEKKSEFNKVGIALTDELNKGISKDTSKVKKSLIDALKETVRETKNYYDEFYSAGSHLVSGFANGIGANTYRAAAKAKAMAEAATAAAKKVLDEHSPSRVFYGIGDFAGQGFVNALSDYVKVSFRAGSDMADGARSGLLTAIDSISNAINSDIDSEPTIRPVVDLSNVESSSRAINGLFGVSPSIGVTGRLTAIGGSISTNQNGTNNDVVTAIKDLKKVVGKLENSSTSYNIGGITYSNGDEIGEVVKELVRVAKMERRT